MTKSQNRSPRAQLGAVAIALSATFGASAPLMAADWSDTSIGYRFGTNFREPYNNTAIEKNIINIEHVSGYKYGTNYLNVDLLNSNGKDPAASATSHVGAQEAYVVYRNTVSLSKVTGSPMKYGSITDVGMTLGFDWNAKSDSGYNSKKRMLVFGPTISLDVPGHLSVGIQELVESNAPCSGTTCVGRYSYKLHPMLSASWGIPLGDLPLEFKGFMNLIAAKGKNEYGGNTATETLIDAFIMMDVGRQFGGPKGMFKVGLGYEYWKNKFGDDASVPFAAPNYGAGSGAFAKTPKIKAEYHF